MNWNIINQSCFKTIFQMISDAQLAIFEGRDQINDIGTLKLVEEGMVSEYFLNCRMFMISLRLKADDS